MLVLKVPLVAAAPLRSALIRLIGQLSTPRLKIPKTAAKGKKLTHEKFCLHCVRCVRRHAKTSEFREGTKNDKHRHRGKKINPTRLVPHSHSQLKPNIHYNSVGNTAY